MRPLTSDPSVRRGEGPEDVECRARVSSELSEGLSHSSRRERGLTAAGLTMAACSFSHTLLNRRVGPEEAGNQTYWQQQQQQQC